MSVRKRDLIMRIAAEVGIQQQIVYEVIEKFFDNVIEKLQKDQTVELRNFGVFKVEERKPRIGRNPKTNTPVPIPKRKKVVFKPGKLMREYIEDYKTAPPPLAESVPDAPSFPEIK